MDTLFDLNLTPDEVDLLLVECNEEINQIKRELNHLLVQKDNLNRKLRAWLSEKEQLEVLRSGTSFDEFLTTAPHDTLYSIRRRHKKMMRRLSELTDPPTPPKTPPRKKPSRIPTPKRN